MTRLRRRAALVLAGLFVVGCGATPPSPTASVASPVAASFSADDPCSLIADVAGAVGREPIASPTAYEVGGTQRCTWVVARDPSRYVGLSVGPAANHGATIDAFGEGEAVTDLGDDARWWAQARTLSVALGDRSFQVGLQLDAGDVTRDAAVGLARQVLGAIGTGG